MFDDLDAAELAGVMSTLVYETRGPDTEVSSYMPTRAMGEAWRNLMKLWNSINKDELKRGVELTKEPDPGFAERAYLWASGLDLDEVLDDEDAPGDFVRAVKQLVDLLRQVEEVSGRRPIVRDGRAEPWPDSSVVSSPTRRSSYRACLSHGRIAA